MVREDDHYILRSSQSDVLDYLDNTKFLTPIALSNAKNLLKTLLVSNNYNMLRSFTSSRIDRRHGCENEPNGRSYRRGPRKRS